MSRWIFLVVAAVAVAAAQAQSFLPQDTPEVAAAKAVHFAEHAKAVARVGAPLQDVYRFATPSFAQFAPAPVVSPEGFIADTPEVAAARAAHLAEHARAVAASPAFSSFAPSSFNPYAEYYRAYYNYYYPNLGRSVYVGHQAVPTVLPSGYLADTPEVAYAKATHLYRLYQESSRV